MRRRESAISNAWLLLALLLLAFAGWRVSSLALADHHATSDPETALGWRSEHAEALIARAQTLSRDPAQAAAAAELAHRALRADPIDGRGYRVLGSLADKAGETARAAELFGLAVARTPRDIPSRTWLASYHLRRGEAEPALIQLDAMFRTAPDLMTRLFPAVLAMASAPQGQGALEARLQDHPPWRKSVVVGIVQRAPDIDAIVPFIARLRAADGGLTDAEEGAWLDRLMRDNRWPQAYLTWVARLPPERLKGLGNVFNGGFEWEPSQTGFDWRTRKAAGFLIGRGPVQGAGGSAALRIRFQDRRVAFDHLRQQLALAPGAYRLSGRMLPDGLETERGLVWMLSCATGRQLGQTEPLRGDGPWREFSAAFEVPAEGCRGQTLALKLPARVPAELRIRGQVWFDDLRIVREAAGPAVPPR